MSDAIVEFGPVIYFVNIQFRTKNGDPDGMPVSVPVEEFWPISRLNAWLEENAPGRRITETGSHASFCAANGIPKR